MADQIEILCEQNSPSDEIIVIHEILVAQGDVVEKEQPLVIAEGSKSLFEIISPGAGKVIDIRIRPGNNVVVGDTLLIIQLE